MKDGKLTQEQIKEINRCLGTLEGFAYFVKDDGVADGLLDVIGRIDAVLKEVETNEAD